MTFDTYFTQVVCINLAKRKDRWAKVVEQCKQYGIQEPLRFEAYPGFAVVNEGQVEMNAGCTASHRAVLEIAAFSGWDRTLILEDDFQFVDQPDLFHKKFESFVEEVPEDWQMLYLGGGYAQDPQYRHSKHVIRINGMATTSSYAVTKESARIIAPHICGIGPIDCLYHKFNRELNSYILDPRIFVQATGYSDIQGRICDNATSMLDPHHVARLGNQIHKP